MSSSTIHYINYNYSTKTDLDFSLFNFGDGANILVQLGFDIVSER